MTLAPRVGAVLAVLAYLVIGVGYLRAVPPWEAPDEPWHAAYAEAVADGRWPTNDETYESHQPPGYYLALGTVLRVLDRPEVQLPPQNPYFPYAEAVYWHPPGEPGAGLARLLRSMTGFLAAAGVALAWAIARRAIGGSLWPMIAALAVALLPQYQFIGHAVSNDGWATLAGGLLVYGGMRAPASHRNAFAPLLIGSAAAVVGKLTALAVVPAAVLGLILGWLKGPRRDAVVLTAAWSLSVVAAAVAFALLATPVWDALWADLGARSGGVRTDVLNRPVAWALTRNTLLSMWGTFGWTTVPVPLVWAQAAAVLVVAGLVGLLPAARRRETWVPMIVPGLAVVGTVAGMARIMVSDPQPQGRLLFPALPALACLLAMGWHGLTSGRERLQWILAGLVVGLLLTTNAVVLGRVLPEAFGPWARPPETVLLRELPAERTITARLEGHGATATQTFQVTGPVESVSVPVHWAAGGGEAEIRLTNAGGQVLGRKTLQLDAVPRDRWIRVDAVAPATGRLAVELEITGGDGQMRLWGSPDEWYAAGELSLDGTPVDRDLALLVTGRGGVD